MRINVLDKGYVRLISYMQPVPDVMYTPDPQYVRPPGWTGDLEIARDANHQPDRAWRGPGHLEHEALCLSRLPPMSNGKLRDCNCTPVERTDEQLIRTMMRRGHTTPFESMVFRFEVKAPIFVFRQWHRHRTWSYDEMSARYEEMAEEYYVPQPEHIGVQDPRNRQGRRLSGVDEIAEIDRQQRMVEGFEREVWQAHERYRARIEEKVPREVARINLPLSTYSKMSATVDLHNLLHFIRLRSHQHAQWEIQQYSNALLRLVAPIVPVTIQQFLRTLSPSEYPGLIEEPDEVELTGNPETKALDAPDTDA